MNTPILLICFNRPDHVRKVLNQIRQLEPPVLYIAQDGPRMVVLEDLDRVRTVRSVINELVDWPCKLKTLYREENLGCGAGPASAIDWFFCQEEMGIVIEDDCLPHPDFFEYCEELLIRYKDDKRVGFINATLYDDRWSHSIPHSNSYGFSHYMVTGAWASWRRSWSGFDLDLHNINQMRFFIDLFRLTHNWAEAEYWTYRVRDIQKDVSKKSYWDFQMQIHLFGNSFFTIHPVVNLVTNIGFDSEATHTIGNDGRGNKPTYPILPLKHPEEISVELLNDQHCWSEKQSKGLFLDIIYSIYHLFSWRKKVRL